MPEDTLMDAPPAVPAAPAVPEEAKEEELSQEEEEKLPFPTAAIVRLMKSRMDGDKMIKKEVKIAMNKWLGNLCVNVSKEMNRFPYVMMHLHEFQKAIEPYTSMEAFQREKDRILSHLDAIKKDIEKLERDLGKIEENMF
ncbi:MAG: hypothetical protein HY369_00420 [Candidatus Aenigmarchaeota archaeon]|nr:hypothetical protein [Candidatus Aenigmarchaeota archaeon]